MVTIKSVNGLQVLDSRGNPTVCAQVVLSDGSAGVGIAPSGASTGAYEAYELRDGVPSSSFISSFFLIYTKRYCYTSMYTVPFVQKVAQLFFSFIITIVSFFSYKCNEYICHFEYIFVVFSHMQLTDKKKLVTIFLSLLSRRCI